MTAGGRAFLPNARVIDQDIQFAVIIFKVVIGFFMGGSVGDIQADGFGVKALLLQLGSGSLALFRVTYAKNQMNAQMPQLTRRLQPQPAVAARYQRYFIWVRLHECIMAATMYFQNAL